MSIASGQLRTKWVAGLGTAGRLAAMAVAVWAGSARAQEPGIAPGTDLNTLVRARIHTDKAIVQAGKPVWVDFVLTNQTENRITLRVPEMSVDAAEFADMGLPVEHVFSGKGFVGPRLEDEHGERRDSKVAMPPKDKVPAIKLSPFGSVGVRLDLAKQYPSITRPGKYKLTWQPYNGSISSEPLEITVLAEQQAVLLTDMGKITIRFNYDKAPAHVQNFIELVGQRFYDNLTFNRVVPGGLVQGGDSLGNRRGVRPDGKRLKAEFNDTPFELGTVGMARSSNDPDSASSQFFICLSRQPAFDGQQTAFGYVVGDESFETLRRIAAVPTGVQNGLADYPKRPVYIRAVSLESVPDRHRVGETTPNTPAASQPSIGVLGREKVSNATSEDSGENVADKLPGLRAQGKVGRRSTTAPAVKQ